MKTSSATNNNTFNKDPQSVATGPSARHGDRPSETTTNVSLVASRDPIHPFGAVVQLPPAIQATFRRKLISIIALQLGVVTLLVALLEYMVPDWLDDNITDNTTTEALLVVALIATVATLHWVRDKNPINWVVLAWLTAVLVACLAAADAMLDSQIVLLNCVFTCVFVTGMVLAVGWTQLANARFNCCDPRGMTFGWSPPLASSSLSSALNSPSSSAAGSQRILASPYVSGHLAFVVACAVIALISVLTNDIGATRDAILISFFAQLVLSCWFLFQIDRSQHRLTPDAYMSGVVYFYADAIVVVGVVAVVVLIAVSCTGGSDGSGAGTTTSMDATLWPTIVAPFYPPTGNTAQGDRDDEEQV